MAQYIQGVQMYSSFSSVPAKTWGTEAEKREASIFLKENEII